MNEKFDYDYTIAIGFQTLDEMSPRTAYRIGCWIGQSGFIDYDISSVGDCYIYYYKGNTKSIPTFISDNCCIHDNHYVTTRKTKTIFDVYDMIWNINNVLADKTED